VGMFIGTSRKSVQVYLKSIEKVGRCIDSLEKVDRCIGRV